MKLQVAIDRIELNDAIKLAQKLDPIVDIIEFGTSLVKDYGLLALNKERLGIKHAEVLLDLKTIDEGAYEFTKGFQAGADILTVMGAASQGTLTTTYQIAQQTQRQMFIDLMEVTDQKIQQIADFEDAIYGLHHAKDSQNSFNATKAVAMFHQKYPQIKRLNVAGGIDLTTARQLSNQNLVETVIVGSKIVKAADPIVTAKEFMEVIR